jgi:hypothetical protein
MDPVALCALPFPALLEAIEAWLDAGEAAAPLLRALAEAPDHEPLAAALRGLARRGRLAAEAAVLGELLVSLPDTGLQRALRGLDGEALEAADAAALRDAAAFALKVRPLGELQATSLLDRWLKNAAPGLRAAAQEEAVAACAAALDSPEALSDELLARVPGAALAALAQAARARGVEARWEARLGRFTAAALGALQARPRSLSQANAEEILSRRVYADPGHFLFELLQNAEDSGAGALALYLDARQAAIWHDGAPFDARDLVGVLSIGQTTKGKDQIGFFGVGFKSVYEVCERPQVYSAPFHFEIADISIPRALGSRPAGPWPEGGTLLILPWRPGLDAARSPARLFARALEIPAETLLTLTHLRRLALHLEGAPPRVVERVDQPDPALVTLRVDGHERRWRVSRGVLTRDDAAPHRAARSEGLVAVPLDARGLPSPLPRGAPTVFSFLPTAERPGLRLLLHARFDLPVDRERVILASPWSQRALAQLGERLVALAASLCEGDEAALDALAEVLPLPEDLAHEGWGALPEALREGAGSLPVLRGSRGEALRAPEARLIDDRALAEALGDAALDAQGRRGAWVGSARRARLARHLGAAPFGALELVALLRERLGALPDGAPWPEAWLEARHGALLEALGRHDAAARALARDPLPLLPDQGGLPRRPAAVARASAALRALYGPTRRFLAPWLEDSGAEGVGRLLRALQVRRWTADDLLEDLRDPAMAAALLDHAGAEALLAQLAALPLMPALGALPLFPDEDGRHRPLHGEGALWLTEAGALGPWLRAMEGARPALLRADLDPALTPWLRALGAQVATLALALDALDAGALRPTAADLRALYAALGEGADQLSAQDRQRLMSAPIWRSDQGAVAALGALRPRAAEEGLEALLRALGDEAVLSEEAAALVAALGLGGRLRRADEAGLIAALGEGRGEDLWRGERRGALLELLLGAARRLPRAALAPLRRARLGRDEAGRWCAPGDWDGDDAGGAHRASGWAREALCGGPRALLAPEDEAALAPLLDALGLRAAGAEEVLARAAALARPGAPLEAQAPLLGSRAALWRLAALAVAARTPEALRGLPLGVDARGALAAAPLWRADEATRALLAGTALEAKLADEGWAAGAPAALAPRLAAGRAVEAILQRLRGAEAQGAPAPLADPGARAALYAWIEAHADEIDADPSALGALGNAAWVWTQDGAPRAPRALLLAAQALPDGLGLEAYSPSEAVPPGLRRWLQGRYGEMGAESLRRLGAALVEAHQRAQSQGDAARSAALWAALAAAHDAPRRSPEALEAVARGLRLHKLRVQTDRGDFERPPKLLAPDPEARALLEGFLRAPPPCLGDIYQDPGARALLRAAGAAPRQAPEALAALLRGGEAAVLPGLEAALCLARYVALVTADDEGARRALGLDALAWVPDAAGERRAPGELYWPGADAEALLGDDPRRYPHPAFSHTVPASLRTSLRFRDPAQAPLEDVLAHLLAAGAPLSAAALGWLEARLRAQEISGDALRDALRGRAVLLDDQGVARPPEALVCRDPSPRDGARRPTWSDGLRYSKLAAALQIPVEPPRAAPPASPPRPVAPPPSPAAPPSPDEAPSPGLWDKLKGLWRAPEPPPAPPAPAPSPPAPPPRAPRQPQDHSRWYAPRRAIEAQLHDAEGWVADRERAPEVGFGFAPSPLPWPWRYAPQLMAAEFDRGAQRWVGSALDPAWLAPAASGEQEVVLQGKLPRGENVFPTPLYGRLVSLRGAGVRQLTTRQGQVMLLAQAPAEVEGRVLLDQPPAPDEAPARWSPPAALLRATAPDHELPAEALDLVSDLRHNEPRLWERAQAIEGFIKARYVYDPTYLEDAAVARWLHQRGRGSANMHLAALHAGADGRHLGRGVCYELGVLACELLRRAEVPALVCTGWTWDRGQLAEPDHLWAMALLPTGAGARWLPVDPSTTDEGRPLHANTRPPAPWRPPSPPRPLQPPPTQPQPRPPRRNPRHARPPARELAQVARHLAAITGESMEDDALLRRCEALLRDPEAARALLALLR